MSKSTLKKAFFSAALVLTTALPNVFGQTVPTVVPTASDSTLIQTVKSKMKPTAALPLLPIIGALETIDSLDGDVHSIQWNIARSDSTATLQAEDLAPEHRSTLNTRGAKSAAATLQSDLQAAMGDTTLSVSLNEIPDTTQSYARLDTTVEKQIKTKGVVAPQTNNISDITALNADENLETNQTLPTSIDLHKENSDLQQQYPNAKSYHNAVRADVKMWETTLPEFDVFNPALNENSAKLETHFKKIRSIYTPKHLNLNEITNEIHSDGRIYSDVFPAIFNVNNAFYDDQAPEIGDGKFGITSNTSMRENLLNGSNSERYSALQEFMMTMANNMGVTGTHAFLDIVTDNPYALSMTVDDFYGAHPEFSKWISKSAFIKSFANETSAPSTITIGEITRSRFTRDVPTVKQEFVINNPTTTMTVKGVDEITLNLDTYDTETTLKGITPYYDVTNMAYGALPGKGSDGNANLRTANLGINYTSSTQRNDKTRKGSIGGGLTAVKNSEASARLSLLNGATFGNVITDNDLFGTTTLNEINIAANDLLTSPLDIGTATINQIETKDYGAHLKGAYKILDEKKSLGAAGYVAGGKDFIAADLKLDAGIKNKKGSQFNIGIGGGYTSVEVDQAETFAPITQEITNIQSDTLDGTLNVIDYTLTPDSTTVSDTLYVPQIIDAIDSTAITTSTPIYDYINDSTFVQTITSVDSFVVQLDPYICEWQTFYDTTNTLVNVTLDSVIIDTQIDTTGWTYDTTQVINIDPSTGDTIFVIDVINTADQPLLNDDGQQIYTATQQDTGIPTEEITTFSNTLFIDPQNLAFSHHGRLKVLDLNANMGFTTRKGLNITALAGVRKTTAPSQTITGNVAVLKNSTQTFQPESVLDANANDELVFDNDGNVIGINQGTGTFTTPAEQTQTTTDEKRDNPFGINIANENKTFYGGLRASTKVAPRTRVGLSGTFAKTKYTGDVKHTLNDLETAAYTDERTIKQTTLGANLSHVFRNNVSVTAGYGYNIVNGNRAPANMNVAVTIPLSRKTKNIKTGTKPVKATMPYEYKYDIK